VNEYTADLVAKRPDRFGDFATPPVPDVDGALQELEHALDTLRAERGAAAVQRRVTLNGDSSGYGCQQ